VVNTLGLLAKLRERDIQVWAEGDRLRCSAPPGALTFELRDELQQRKPDILEFLRSAVALAREPRAIVPLQPRGTRTPIFAVAGHNGDVFCYRALARHLGEDQPFFGLQPPGLDGQSEPLARVEDLAGYFAAQIRAFRPDGPYVIAGYCAGGTVAFELGRQLLRDGAEIDAVVLFGSPFATWYRFLPQLRYRLRIQIERVARHTRALALLSFGERRLYIAEKLRNLKVEQAAERPAAPDPVLVQRAKVERATFTAVRRYVPGYFAGRLGVFLPTKTRSRAADAMAQWRSVAERTDEYFGPADCDSAMMLREPYAPVFAEFFRQFARLTARPAPEPHESRCRARQNPAR
jgi:thioesterase domain-containing protein